MSYHNAYDSPIYEIFNVAERAKILDTCMNMVLNGHSYPKSVWSKMVWEKVWDMEDEEYTLYKNQLAKEKLLFQVIDKPYYLAWWVLADRTHDQIEQCEIMARIVCDSSLLKTADVRREKASLASRFCDKCELGIEENAMHVVMQCPFFEGNRKVMLDELNSTGIVEIDNLLRQPSHTFLYIMGKQPENVSFEDMTIFWEISSRHISSIYKRVTGTAGR